MVQPEQWHDAPEAAGGAAAVVMESDLDAAGCIWLSLVWLTKSPRFLCMVHHRWMERYIGIRT
jgi:hypothetical protein